MFYSIQLQLGVSGMTHILLDTKRALEQIPHDLGNTDHTEMYSLVTDSVMY